MRWSWHGRLCPNIVPNAGADTNEIARSRAGYTADLVKRIMQTEYDMIKEELESRMHQLHFDDGTSSIPLTFDDDTRISLAGVEEVGSAILDAVFGDNLSLATKRGDKMTAAEAKTAMAIGVERRL